MWGGEWMVYCGQIVFVVVFEYWEVNYLQWCLFVFVGQVQVFVQFQMQCVQCISNYFFVICVEEDYVIVLCVGMFKDSVDDVGGQEFGYWIVNFVQIFCVFVNFDICQFFCVVDFNKVIVIVDLFMVKLCVVRYMQCCYVVFWIVSWVCEDCEFY